MQKLAKLSDKYNHVATVIQRLRDLDRKERSIISDLEEALIISSTTKNRQELLQCESVTAIMQIFDATENADIQEKLAAILANIAISHDGRLALSNCDGWKCLSFRHFCPLARLLDLVDKGLSQSVKRVAAAAILNVSVCVEGKLQIQELSGLFAMLRTVRDGDEGCMLYAAATLWNLLKLPNILLELETRHSILKEPLEKQLSQILDSHCREFDLFLTDYKERGVPKCMKTDGPNLQYSLAVSIGSTMQILLRVEEYMDDRFHADSQQVAIAEIQRQEESKKKKKAIRLDEEGQALTNVCDVCDRLCRSNSQEVSLFCNEPECNNCFHLQCSRWSVLDPDDVDEDMFYCETCVLNHYVQLPDLILELQGKPIKSVMTKKQFRKKKFVREHMPMSIKAPTTIPTDTVILTADHRVVGVGRFLYTVEDAVMDPTPSKKEVSRDTDTPMLVVVELTYMVKKVTSMWYDDNLTDGMLLWGIRFCGEERNEKNYNLIPGNFILWPQNCIQAIDQKITDSKTIQQLESAALYHLYSERPYEEFAPYAFGRTTDMDLSSLTECPIWGEVFPTRAKCTKFIMDILRTKRQEEKGHKKNKKERAKTSKAAKSKLKKKEAAAALEAPSAAHQATSSTPGPEPLNKLPVKGTCNTEKLDTQSTVLSSVEPTQHITKSPVA